MRVPDAEGKAGSSVGADDRAVYLKVQHIAAADSAAGAPTARTIPVSNAQVQCTCGTKPSGSGGAEEPHRGRLLQRPSQHGSAAGVACAQYADCPSGASLRGSTPRRPHEAVHPTAAQVQQAAADEQAAVVVSHWKGEVPIAGQLSAVSCQLQDACWYRSHVALPGERPTVWPVYQQTVGTQSASGTRFQYDWVACQRHQWCGVVGCC